MQQNTKWNKIQIEQNEKMSKYETRQNTRGIVYLVFQQKINALREEVYYMVVVFWYFCILFYLYFVPFVPFLFCCICILLHLYYDNLYFVLLFFVLFVFWHFSILFYCQAQPQAPTPTLGLCWSYFQNLRPAHQHPEQYLSSVFSYYLQKQSYLLG